MSKLSVLMTVYNEADFIEYAIRACLPHVDHLVIVEGAYKETIALGAEPRSTDGTYEIVANIRDLESIRKLFSLGFNDNAIMDLYCKLCPTIYVNEQTDKDQRNVGLEKIKELNPDGWCLIIDGDEVYDDNTFKMIRVVMNTMEKSGKLAAYFKSLTFVNDFKHFTYQKFPRLFKIDNSCFFESDNYMKWPKKNISWFSPYVIELPYIKYYHYAFCKGSRFELKSEWWNTRFGKDSDFQYDWYRNEDGELYSPNHKIYIFSENHPDIMKTHPMWERCYGS